MRNICKLLMALPLLSVAPLALAETTGFAVIADLGSARQSAEGDAGNAASASLGLSYQFSPNWSASLSYIDYGNADVFKFSDSFGDDIIYHATLSADSSGLGLHAQYMTDSVAGHWSFGGRAGVVRWDTDIKLAIEQTGAGGTVASDSGIAFSAGLVAAYSITEQLDITLSADFMRYSIEIEDEKGDMDNSRLALGLKYQF
ncbi:outer membrane beta-barrel protein [Rheinheimera sediminis]|uniref:outer membrane beta-barrel protein n=1 Tax=Rheinheimera sp. YQF-1 TaxID=2499626 RepID=UPI001647D4BF|nr:outer membrane beta-barrel protein [Rheinheimera sp. YQF-1]